MITAFLKRCVTAPWRRAWLALAFLALSAAAQAEPAAVSFHRQVRPIFQRRCQGCHQPANLGGKLLLTSYAGVTKGGDHGPAIQRGKPNASLIVQYVSG